MRLFAFLTPLLMILASCGGSRTANKKETEVSVQKLKEAADSGRKIFVLDVRTLSEFQASRLAFTSHRVSFDILSRHLDELPEDKDAEIYCFSRSGRRSGISTKYLRGIGYTRVYNVSGGIIAWNKAGYDVVSGD